VVKADFRVIMPRKKDEAAPVERPMVRFDPFAKERPVGLTEPALDVNQKMKQARDALAAGEYGAAAEHLDRILMARPEDATTRFLKSQAQFAAGQYSEAVATIRVGLKADAKWPLIEIQPRTLFGKAERFDGLFGDLKRSRDGNPDSLALQFLVAHQHWFAGDRDAAKAAFARLADRLNDPDVVKAFLK
jgi:thioredoxin-like negative regulator of GroEL